MCIICCTSVRSPAYFTRPTVWVWHNTNDPCCFYLVFGAPAFCLFVKKIRYKLFIANSIESWSIWPLHLQGKSSVSYSDGNVMCSILNKCYQITWLVYAPCCFFLGMQLVTCTTWPINMCRSMAYECVWTHHSYPVLHYCQCKVICKVSCHIFQDYFLLNWLWISANI